MPPVTPRASRAPIATVAGLAFVVAYVVLAVTLADQLPQHWAVRALYWTIAGVLWVLPVWALMLWSARRR